MRTRKQEQEQKQEKAGCHCRGERILIVIGNRNDATIREAKKWALGFPNVV